MRKLAVRRTNCRVPLAALCAVVGMTGAQRESHAADNTGCPPSEPASVTNRAANVATDEAMRVRVQAALHSDRYFYDKHVTVSAEHGAVYLRGFVFSEWDLRQAVRIATDAACQWTVVDELFIELGGNR